jgi:hypothetical protein
MYMYNPVYTAAGPLMSSYPFYNAGLYGVGGSFGRYGFGPNYGLGWANSFYNPYNYMSGTYW